MTKPIRIQRKRTKGWRMPENTVYVGRGSRWGNPHKIGDMAQGVSVEVGVKNFFVDGMAYHFMTAKEVVRKYARELLPYRHQGPTSTMHDFYLSEANLRDIVDNLKGKNLACWCELDKPCHADFLLEVANEQ